MLTTSRPVRITTRSATQDPVPADPQGDPTQRQNWTNTAQYVLHRNLPSGLNHPSIPCHPGTQVLTNKPGFGSVLVQLPGHCGSVPPDTSIKLGEPLSRAEADVQDDAEFSAFSQRGTRSTDPYSSKHLQDVLWHLPRHEQQQSGVIAYGNSSSSNGVRNVKLLGSLAPRRPPPLIP